MATKMGAAAFNINAGEIAVGKLADCILLDLNHYNLVGGDNLVSHLVYSAGAGAVNTVICNGRIIMENGQVEAKKR